MIIILKHTRILLIGFFALITLYGKDTIGQETESGINEFWQEIYVYRNFSQKWSGEILFNNLYSKKLGHYDWFLEGKVSYRAVEWLAVEAMYRHEFYDLNGEKVQEYRPMIRFVGQHELGIWSIRNRHRFELRMFEIGENKFRYRTDLKIKPNFDWTPLKLGPYVHEEIFIGYKGLSRNRIYLGIEGKYGRVELLLSQFIR